MWPRNGTLTEGPHGARRSPRFAYVWSPLTATMLSAMTRAHASTVGTIAFVIVGRSVGTCAMATQDSPAGTGPGKRSSTNSIVAPSLAGDSVVAKAVARRTSAMGRKGSSAAMWPTLGCGRFRAGATTRIGFDRDALSPPGRALRSRWPSDLVPLRCERLEGQWRWPSGDDAAIG
jgi:hypothetical protein